MCLFAGATKWYCSPTGSDVTGTGTISAPYFSLSVAWTAATAGDTIYLRGGVYSYPIAQEIRGKAHMKVWNYPGETPVFHRGDYVQDPEKYFDWIGIFGDYCNGLSIKGIEVSYYPQFTHATWGAPSSFGIWLTDIDTVHMENMNVHHNGGGVMFNNCSDVTVINSDFHHNQDSLGDDPYGGADGLVLRNEDDTTSVSTVRGCRFWWNSDDGLDLWYNDGVVYIDSCWSFYNGYTPGTFSTGGDGSGFKNGATAFNFSSRVKRYYTRCISARNRSGGLDNNGALCGTNFYNCLSYLNTRGMTFNNGYPVIRNVIAYANTAYNTLDDKTNWDHTNNSWNGAVTVDDTDFESLDTTQLYDSRVNNYLPSITFGTLASISDLIDAGIDVGLLYTGIAPDLGFSEYEEITIPTVTTVATSSITTTTAISGGDVTSEGDTTVTARGVCWGTSANPTVLNSHTSDGSGTGIFTSNITGLSSGTTYHVRAYATNNAGTAYGIDRTFTTLSISSFDNTTIKYRNNIVKHKNKIIIQ